LERELATTREEFIQAKNIFEEKIHHMQVAADLINLLQAKQVNLKEISVATKFENSQNEIHPNILDMLKLEQSTISDNPSFGGISQIPNPSQPNIVEQKETPVIFKSMDDNYQKVEFSFEIDPSNREETLTQTQDKEHQETGSRMPNFTESYEKILMNSHNNEELIKNVLLNINPFLIEPSTNLDDSEDIAQINENIKRTLDSKSESTLDNIFLVVQDSSRSNQMETTEDQSLKISTQNEGNLLDTKGEVVEQKAETTENKDEKKAEVTEEKPNHSKKLSKDMRKGGKL